MDFCVRDGIKLILGDKVIVRSTDATALLAVGYISAIEDYFGNYVGVYTDGEMAYAANSSLIFPFTSALFDFLDDLSPTDQFNYLNRIKEGR